MTRLMLKSLIGTMLIAALLAGARSIIRENEAAMAGNSGGRPSGFYGH